MTVPTLSSTVLAAAVLFALFYPLGFVIAFVVDVARFRVRSWPERLLWSMALANPAALVFAPLTGRILPPRIIAVILCAIGVFALVLCVRLLQSDRKRTGDSVMPTSWHVWAGLFAMLAIAASIVCVASPVIVGDSLYEGGAFQDWAIRVPQLAAVMRSGVPPANPFNAIPTAPPLRYYYFWWELMGFAGKLFALPARSAMMAGGIWSAFSLYATLLLCLKYLIAPVAGGRLRLRPTSLLAIVLSFALGYDVLFIGPPLVRARYILPELEWWKGTSGFAPSFHTAYLTSPHLAAGIGAAFIAVLLIVLPVLHPAEEQRGMRYRLTLAVVAGVAFAAIAGSTSFIALIFAVAGTFLFVERLSANDRRTCAMLAVAACVGAVLSADFLRFLYTHPAARMPGHSEPLLEFGFRSIDFSNAILNRLCVHWHKPMPHGVLHVLCVAPIYTIVELSEPGVLLFAIFHRLRKDWLGQDPMPQSRRMQWALFLSFAVVAMFISSAPMLGSNDLGFHASLALRFLTVLWLTPWVADIFFMTTGWFRLPRRVLPAVALMCALIGFCTQAFQYFQQRFFNVLLVDGYLNPASSRLARPSETAHDDYDAFQAAAAVQRSVPKNAVLLTNPAAQTNGPDLYNSNRQLVAGDRNCFVIYGGDANACVREMPRLLALYGAAKLPEETTPLPVQVDFNEVCHENGAFAALVSSDDPVWFDESSWARTLPPIYENRSRRLIACPGRGNQK